MDHENSNERKKYMDFYTRFLKLFKFICRRSVKNNMTIDKIL